MADEDVRWKQRFINFRSSVTTQEKAQALEAEIRDSFADPLSRLAADLEARL